MATMAMMNTGLGAIVHDPATRTMVQVGQLAQSEQWRPAQTTRSVTVTHSLASMFGASLGNLRSRPYPRRGWSVAEDRRRARKARNRARNRRMHRS